MKGLWQLSDVQSEARMDLHSSTHIRPAHVCAGLLPVADGGNNNNKMIFISGRGRTRPGFFRDSEVPTGTSTCVVGNRCVLSELSKFRPLW